MITLASASAVRASLLKAAGVAFEVATSGVDEAQAKVATLSKAGASNFEKLAGVGKYAMLAVAAAAVSVGAAAVDFGNKYEDAAELLEKAATQYKLAKCCE